MTYTCSASGGWACSTALATRTASTALRCRSALPASHLRRRADPGIDLSPESWDGMGTSAAFLVEALAGTTRHAAVVTLTRVL
ncbi:hypothetical protein [Streptomyces sp. NPDC086835]|uniref:hypothetical protein n=1 Tax=Streptomyces sp. NPDC086835 TaxID=3365761 RepID=UPI00382E8AA5